MKNRPRISVHPLTLTGLCALFFLSDRRFLICAAISAASHEAGHLISALLQKKTLTSVSVTPLGINLTYSAGGSYAGELALSCAGLIVNALIFAAGYLTGRYALAFASLFLLVVNSLPVPGLDGGEILRITLGMLTSERVCASVCALSGCIFTFFIWSFSLFLFFESGINIGMLIFSSYIWAYFLIKTGIT